MNFHFVSGWSKCVSSVYDYLSFSHRLQCNLFDMRDSHNDNNNSNDDNVDNNNIIGKIIEIKDKTNKNLETQWKYLIKQKQQGKKSPIYGKSKKNEKMRKVAFNQQRALHGQSYIFPPKKSMICTSGHIECLALASVCIAIE